jgi:transposase
MDGLDDHVRRSGQEAVATIPGVGPIGSSMLSMKAPPPETFRSGRDFAAWLGLTPKDHSTGGRQRHGGITKAGDSVLRSTYRRCDRAAEAYPKGSSQAHTLARFAAGAKAAEVGCGGLG